MRAVIVGGGIGGLAAAVALTRRDVEVRVYEQAPRLAEVGAGVVLAPNSLRLLDRMGLGAGISRLGTRLSDTRLCLADGQPAAHGPDQFGRPGQLVGMHRADMLALLAGALPTGTVRTGQRCTGFRQDANGAVVTFSHGESAEADVVIGADGIHSVLQEHVAEPAAPVFSGVIAHRGVIGVPPGYPAGTMRMWLGEGKHFLAFPVRAGHAGRCGRPAWGKPGPRRLPGAQARPDGPGPAGLAPQRRRLRLLRHPAAEPQVDLRLRRRGRRRAGGRRARQLTGTVVSTWTGAPATI